MIRHDGMQVDPSIRRGRRGGRSRHRETTRLHEEMGSEKTGLLKRKEIEAKVIRLRETSGYGWEGIVTRTRMETT